MLAKVPFKGTAGMALLVTGLLLGGRALRESPAVPAPSVLDVLPGDDPQVEAEHAVASREGEPAVPSEPLGPMIPATEPCTRPTVEEQIALHDRIATWIDRRYSREVSDADEWASVSFGCVERGAIVVDVDADRTLEGHERPDIGRWWTLRVTPDRIVTLAETLGTPVNDWMEWEIEASIETLALVDIDRDGAHDVLFAREVHEGGAFLATYDFSIAHATGRTTFVAHRELGLDEVVLEPHGVVLVTDIGGEETRYCIRVGLQLRRCR